MDEKWMGTKYDKREMRALNLQQVVRRNFGSLAMFGFASTLLCTWENIAIRVGVALPNGGTAGLFWNYVIGAVGLGLVYASIAELGSMIPTSGGQYYWVAVLAPRRYRRYLSYITGWLCGFTWQTGIAGCSYIAGTLVQGLFVLNIQSYTFERWHGSLLTLAFLFLSLAFNTFLARRLPIFEAILVFCHILGVAIFIPLWVLLPRAQSGQPIVEFYNQAGWSSNGLATLVGISGPITSLIGFDCSVHMTEETKDSSRIVPITLLTGYTSNVLLGFFALMTIIYTIGPLDAALDASTGYPIINLFFNATQSLAATNFMTAVVIINFTAADIACIAAASRQVWAFARNRGVPFSNFIAPDRLVHDIPLNAVITSLIMAIIIALINIASAEALAIILSIFNSALLASYTITICCILFHRLQGRRLPQARYTLGKWGALVNVLALVYIIPLLVFSFFPPTPNPTPATMNWACVMVGGTVIFATVYYIAWGRKTYTPPNEVIEDFIERYQTTTSEMEAGSMVIEESVEAKKLEN